MKLTTRHLHRIIKEEKRKLLREYRGVEADANLEETLFNALDEYVMMMAQVAEDVPPDQLKANVYEFVDSYFQQTEEPAGGWE
jgi:hypothetical protein